MLPVALFSGASGLAEVLKNGGKGQKSRSIVPLRGGRGAHDLLLSIEALLSGIIVIRDGLYHADDAASFSRTAPRRPQLQHCQRHRAHRGGHDQVEARRQRVAGLGDQPRRDQRREAAEIVTAVPKLSDTPIARVETGNCSPNSDGNTPL